MVGMHIKFESNGINNGKTYVGLNFPVDKITHHNTVSEGIGSVEQLNSHPKPRNLRRQLSDRYRLNISTNAIAFLAWIGDKATRGR